MAKVRINQSDIPATLYRLGVDYYSSLTFTMKEKMYFGFKCDRLTNELKEKLSQMFPQVEFFCSSPQYAPEIKKAVIAFPRKTQLYMVD